MGKIRVLIADDHLVVREGLTTILLSTGEFEIVGQAVNGQEAIDQAKKLRPDVVLIDVQMPQLSGIEATHLISQQIPTTRVVILSSFDQDEYVYRGIQAGAKGYLLKDGELDELLNVVRAAARGESLLPPRIATKLVDRIAVSPGQQSLTCRETEVLHSLAQGLRNKEIAAQLHITERTVKNHVANIIAKLGVKSRTEALSHALKEGLVKLE
jgi:DNA-binding NarL/FixJ family response regulator